MSKPASATSPDRWKWRFCLWVILGVAAALRLWRLGLPSLWFDEAVVAMAAKLPVRAVFERVFLSDFHPPFYYLLTKLVMLAGTSDFVLRLPSALFGVAGVWLGWRAGRELVSPLVGLAMAAVCAVLPWHVLLSRQLRPYSLIFFFCLLSLIFLIRTVRNGRVRDAALAGLSLWPCLFLHYASLLAAGGAGCVLICAMAARRTGWRHLLVFGVLAVVPVAVNLPFLLASLGHEQGLAGAHDRLRLALLCLEKLGDLLFREPVAWARPALAVLALTGLAGLWRRDRVVALVSLGWVVFPLLALVAVDYDSYFNPWHLMFLMPVAALWLACAVSLAPWPGLPVILCLAAAGLYVTKGVPYYYSETSYGGDAKVQARRIAAGHGPGTAYVYPQSAVVGPINWYLDQSSEPNPLRAQSLGPEDQTVRLVIPGENTEPRVLKRNPVIAMGSLPFYYHVSAAPDDFLAQVHDMRYVACQPVLENVLIATEAGQTGQAEFTFQNSRDVPQAITVHFGYWNHLPGNRFAVFCRFDDEPWAGSFESQGPDGRGHEKIEISHRTPYRFLTVRFELMRDGRSPAFTGEDLQAVRLIDFKVQAVPLE